MTSNIPVPTDFLDGFQKGKLPQSNLEVLVKRTRKEKPIDKDTLPPGTPHETLALLHKKYAKMLDYVVRRMKEKGLDMRFWKVWYDHHFVGTHYESRLRLHKDTAIEPEEGQRVHELMEELNNIPFDVMKKILGD